MNSLIGIGGGFMERDNVEYIERDDSDDEYDEVVFIYVFQHEQSIFYTITYLHLFPFVYCTQTAFHAGSATDLWWEKHPCICRQLDFGGRFSPQFDMAGKLA